MEDLLDIRYLLGVLRRRWLLILAPIVIGLPLALLAAYVLPPVYLSSGRILIASQQIPTELAASTVVTGPEERIKQLQQRLTTRENLLELARRYDVFAGFGDLSPSQIVQRMRQGTSIQSISFTTDSRGREVINAVEIAFRAQNPRTAAQVTNEFITQLLAQNAQQRAALAAETVEFFNAQVQTLAEDLAALEDRITAFKTANGESLPENLAFQRQMLTNLERDANSRESRQLMLEERKRSLEETIAFGPEAGTALTPEEQELQRLRFTLAQQSAIYSPTHPSMRSLTARIATLEEVVEGATLSDATSDSSPAARRLSSAQAELERIEAELALLEEQRQADTESRRRIEEAMARTPQVDAQLAALMRDHSALRAQYEQAVMRRAAAATGERLEVNNQAERLEVLEQPQVPEEPISPNRVMIAGLGGVLSVGLGIGLAVLAELLNRSLRTARDLERRLELRPIVSIPYIRTEAEIRRRRWSLRLAVFLALVVIPAALFAVDQYVLPLPLLFEEAAEAVGLDEAINLIQRRFGG